MQESGPNGFDDSMHCVTPAVPLLPALLKAEGFATHALGKWDVGYVQRHCLPCHPHCAATAAAAAARPAPHGACA